MYVTAEYGVGKLVLVSVLDAVDSPAGLTLENDPALAAADVSLISDEQSLTECAAEHVAFTSGSVKPSPGDTISGATGGSTAVVIGVLLSSGTWGAGTAAGTLWVEQASGAFQSENLDNDTTGGTNFATIAGDLTDSAIDSVGRTIGIGLTSSEMTCRQFNIELRDATATEVYLETFIPGHTIGHPDAEYENGSDGALLLSTTIESVATQQDIDLVEGMADDGGIPAGSIVIITDQANARQKTVVRATSYDQSDNQRLQLSDAPAFTVAVGDIVEVYAISPAIGLDGSNLTEAGGTGDQLTALATSAALATVDGNVDAILVDTGTTLPATLATIAGYLDTEIAAILADTNEMQGDLVDGGRIDALIDAIKAKTDQLAFTVANRVDSQGLGMAGQTFTGDGQATPYDVVDV